MLQDATAGDLIIGFASIGGSLLILADKANSCRSKLMNTREMQVFFEMTGFFAQLHNPTAISLVVGSHILLGGVDIYREISAAYTNYFANEYEEFGRDIGAAFALVYIGPSGVNKLSKEDQAKLKDMIEISMYPSLT